MNRAVALMPLIVLIGACEKGELNKSAITTTVDNSVYHNELFEIDVEKPESWYSQNIEEMIALQQRGNQVLAGKDKNLKAIVDSSLETTIPLFGFFEFAPGTPGKLIPNVVSSAENISPYPGVKSGCDYLYHVKDIISKSQVNMTFGENCIDAEISGQKFGSYDSSMSIGNITIYQKYYACRKGNHAVNFIQTYFDDESREKTDKILNTVKITCDK